MAEVIAEDREAEAGVEISRAVFEIPLAGRVLAYLLLIS